MKRMMTTGAAIFLVLLTLAHVFNMNTHAQTTGNVARWTVISTPAVSNQASASKAAGTGGQRHVAECISFSAASTTAPVLTKLNVNLRDGATGAGNILASFTVVIPAATGQNVAPFSVCELGIVGSANTAMTLEFSSLLANLFEDVTLTGRTLN